MNFSILLIALLGTLTYLLNFFNKVAECSVVFILIAVTANLISELYSRKKAIIGLIASIVVSFSLLWNFVYYIHGVAVPGVIMASFVSLLVSIYCSTSIFLYLKPTYSFNTRNFASLLSATLIDGIIMSSFFLSRSPVSRVIQIFSKELLFKCLYSAIIYALVFSILYFIDKMGRKSKAVN